MMPEAVHKNPNIRVLLITEGTYPFYSGGVSTWAHELCSRVRNATFEVYAITSDYEPQALFPRVKGVDRVMQVPMWSPEEPVDYLDYRLPYDQLIIKRERSNKLDIERLFIPHFVRFMKAQQVDNPDMEELDHALKGMWRFFKRYDFKETMTNHSVWNSFKQLMLDFCSEKLGIKAPLADLTTAMRWVYHFLLPLSLEAPRKDVCHLTLSGFAGLPAIAQKYRYGTPILLTEHGVFIRERMLAIGSSDYSFFLKQFLIGFSEVMTRLVYHHADLISTVSKFNRGWEIKYGADANKIRVLYNGVNTELFKPDPDVEAPERPTVVAAARIFELKDILTMIRTCDWVRKSIPDIRFVVYGDKKSVPSYTAQCEELIRKLRLENHFTLAGFHPEPSRIFLEGKLSILTSISEGFPFTVIESMSCGIPVVATDVGGVSEAIDQECGIICKPRDYQALAQAVIELLENDPLRLEMGKKAREKVLNHFSMELFISGFEKLYTELAFVGPQLKFRSVNGIKANYERVPKQDR